MAARSQADSKRKYSWWWDSHISPKNSKWLQENLTDMDSKVKQMIKLIEEDADSFARRAEMYYKKRPELMKLVEEFYRAYRALAERYDHATGALHQAQRTMAEAFPNQAPFILGDDSPAGSATDCDPRTPDMPPIRAPFDPDELQKDALGVSPSHAINRNGAFTEKSDPGRKGLKQFNDLFGLGDGMDNAKFAEGRVRKGLNFHDPEEKGRGVQNNGIHDLKARAPSESEQVSKAELEILNLKNALAKLEAEKEAGLLQYEQSLERLSKLESEVSRATEDSRGLNERASKAEAEVQTLKEVLAQLEAEKESSFLQYQGCLEKISNLENNLSLVQKDAGELNERASKAETEARSLKQDLSRLEAEKIDAQVQYSQCLEKISDLEDKLHNAQEDAKRFSERADDAEREIEALKHALTRLTEEKEAAVTQYQQCLATIVSLEHKIACFEEEARRLNLVIDNGTVKLKSSEERCLLLEKSNQTIHSELESVMQKVAAQSNELTEKQKELGRLWACVQEEHLRFMEAETAFQTLQHLHSQSQEELRSVVAQLQNRAQILEDLEARNQSLKDEVEHVKVENKSLSEVNLSSALTIQNLQDEISSLRETIKKLEAEVELRVDQRNALQQEIYCLKEELNELNQKHQAIMRQVESVGFSPESFGSSVKDLKDVNIKLKEVCERDRTEKVALLEKLENMEKLIDKNALLENSLSDLNVELEGVGEKLKALEESCQYLVEEKSVLVSEKDLMASELQFATDDLEKLTEKNHILENFLLDANAELEGLREKSKSLEDFCLLLVNEKSELASMKGSLSSQLDISEKSLQDLEKNYTELEEKYSHLEKERQSSLHEVQELQVRLDAEKQEHANLAQLSESQLAGMASQICLLQEESLCRKKEYEKELDKAVNAEIEIFILQKCAQELEEKNSSLLLDHQKLVEASKLSEKLISDMRHENCEQQEEVKCLSDKIKTLRMGLYQVLMTLELDANQCENKPKQDQKLLNHVLNRLQESQEFLFKTQDENQRLFTENSVLVTLLRQLQLEVENLVKTKNILDQELTTRSEQFLVLQNESQELSGINEEMKLKLIEGDRKEEALKVELNNLHVQLSDLQGAFQNLQGEGFASCVAFIYMSFGGFILTNHQEHRELSFVERNGTQFMVDGRAFYINGWNSYWLMDHSVDEDRKPRVGAMLEAGAKMGLTVCRTWAFNDGGYNALQVSPGRFDERVLRALDYVIAEARQHGVRLLLSLVNNLKAYGGKTQYVNWAWEEGIGLSSSNDSFFFDPSIKRYFKHYVKTLLTRKNTITGIEYRNDPTIFAWELMNEPRCMSDPSGDTLQDWIEEMSAFVKTIDKNHLLTVGLEGFYGPKNPKRLTVNPESWASSLGSDFVRNSKAPAIDFASVHIYPDHWFPHQEFEDKLKYVSKWMLSHIEDGHYELSKPVFFTEFGLSNLNKDFQPSQRDRFYKTIFDIIYKSSKRKRAGAGALIWQLFVEGMDDFNDDFGIVPWERESTNRILTDQSCRLARIHGISPQNKYLKELCLQRQ